MNDPHARLAGVCLHLSSLPGRWGIGDIGAGARAFVDWMHTTGLGVWQFLPIGPTGYGNSPYQLLSVFAGNPLFIDLEDVAALGLLTRAELDEHPSLPADRVDYGAVIDVRRDYLAKATARFGARSELAGEYAAFVAEHDALWLDNYALYATLKDHYGQAPWGDWDAVHRDRDAAALASWRTAARASIEAVKQVQFLFWRQWQTLRLYAADRHIRLFGDLPIYLALDCAEAWARSDLLLLDAAGAPIEVAGVPPDYFSADGQLWGSPLYRWEAHAAEGYAWWIARLAHMLGGVDLVRLDHFRGFEAYWAIPAGAPTAREGQWRPGPGTSFFDAVAEAFGTVPIVAEDLGVITEEVTALRKVYGIPGMQVLQFLVDQAGFSLDAIPEDCVCYTGTHDNDTTVGWFQSADGHAEGEARGHWQQRVLERLGGTSENISNSLINMAFHSQASIAIAPMQDYLGLGSEARMNRPGESGDHWRWRLAPDALGDPVLAGLPAMIVESERMIDAN